MKKVFLLPTLISIIIFLCLPIPAYSLWENYKDIGDINIDGDFKVGYIDIDGDFINEIIIEKQYGVGSNHYQEDMRIFKDPTGNEELELIFYIVTLDSTFGFSGESRQCNCDIISEVEFSEPDINSGLRDIIVKSKKIYYKDDENKIIDKEEDLWIKTFKWDGMFFVEDSSSHKVDLDNNGEKELITVQHQFETIMEGRPQIEMGGIATVSNSDKSKIGNFSMPDHMDKVEFISLNKDGFKQIVAWGSGGAHYTNVAIYGYKDSKLYEIFKNGSFCGVNAYLDASPPMIKVGSANWGVKVITEEGEEINWSFSSESLWKVYTWNGEELIYSKDLSTSPDFSPDKETKRYLDKARSLITGDNNK